MSTSARHNEEFTAPVQLESLLEVPVKLILIEDLIREKSALVHPDCVDISKEKNNNQRLSQSAEGSNSPPHDKDTEAEEGSPKKCLFECCATPSRWRNTECYSNKSFFRTVSIPLPCNSLAVIPVMQVEESAVSNTSKSTNFPRNVSAIMPNPANLNANEDLDTDVEMNKESDDEKDARKKSLSEVIPLLVSSKNPLPTNTTESGNDTNKLASEEDDEDDGTTTLPKKSNIENVIEQKTSSPRNDGEEIQSKSPSLQAPEFPPPSSSSSTTFIGKVTEKPTRFEDLISGHCNNTVDSETSSSTITSNKQQCQQDVTREEENNGSEGSTKSADDTLKLTFYNEGRKESTKEFRTTGIESGGASSPGSDVRFFESRHGLQMSRVIREVGAATLERIARIEQQHSGISSEGESDGSKDPKNDVAQNCHKNSSGVSSRGDDAISPLPETITQTHLQRLISSTDQKKNNNSSDTNSPTNSNSGTGNNNSNKDIDKSASSPHERPWDGLRISRCQKEIVGEVITLEGESSSHEPSVSDTSHLPSKEKGETENSVERHLQSYLTSMRFVKPTESGNGKNNDHQDGDNAKAKSPVISPQSRQAHTTPVISPVTRSPGSCSLASGGSVTTNDGVVRVPVVQRVSPSSQQDLSSESWPERSIARIPTRPYLRRNITYELNPSQSQQQQQQQHQQSIITQRQNIRGNIPTPNYQQQQQRVEEMPILHATQQASPTEFPLHSPPKRFKSTILPTSHYGNSPISPSQPHVQQQHHPQNQPTVLNRYPSNVAQSQPQQSNRIVSAGISHNDNTSQQHQHHSALSPNNVSWVRNSGTNYNNMQQQQHYHNNIPRPSSTSHHYASTSSNVTNKISPPQRSPAAATQPLKYHANTYSQSQQHLEYQRQLQQSLLIASSSLASSSTEPIDSSYEERLRRYTEIYQRQQLDKNKLSEYYDKYHFYPWDILTARDESIIRQMRSQQQGTHSHVPQSPNQHSQTSHAHQQAASKESMTNSVVQYDASRRIEIENTSLQHQQRQFQTRPSNLEHSPVRNLPAPTFSPSYASATNVSPPMISPQQSTQHIQPRYSHVQQMQQIQHSQQRGDYAAHQQQQQQAHNRYYHHQNDQPDQNYRHHNQQTPSRVIQSPIGTIPTSRDIQNSPHYRSAYNQLAAAAAAVSSVAAGTAVGGTNAQNPLRISDGRTSTNPGVGPTREERIQFLHSRSSGVNKPVIMTVADPVHAPAPPEAVPLSIHRQALEQAIKSNQSGVVHHSAVSNLHGIVNRDDGSSHYRHEQRTIPISHQSHHHYNRQVMSQQSYYDHPHPRSVTIDGRVVTGLGVQSVANEPLRRVPSPTLAHQTSVIRRIQQQESSPPVPARSPFVTGSSVSRHFIESDRPGISFRRISEGSGADSNGGTGVQANPASFMYQQQHKENNVQASTPSHYQQLHHRLNNSFAPRHPSSEVPIQRNMMTIENGQGISRAIQKRRIIITDNNGINQNHPERCHEVGSTQLIPRGGDITANQVELPGRDEDRGNSLGDDCQYDHVVLIDKHNKTYRCKRCFETVKTEQQIRNHLFCKMLANHVQCHVCLQLITADKYPEHLLIHGVQPPENLDN